MSGKWMTWVRRNRRKAVICGTGGGLLLAGAAAGICFLSGTGGTESVYKETKVMHGSLTVGITESGSVAVGMVEQSFALDISEYSGGERSFSFGGPFGGMGGSESTDSRQLEVEEVFVAAGQQITKGESLFSLTQESVQDIREELESDKTEAEITLNKLAVEQKKTSQEAAHAYEANRVYGQAADLEYQEALYDLEKKVEESQEALEESREELTEYEEELETEKADYSEALTYLEEAEYAAANESDAYWYMKNEEVREQAGKEVDSGEERIEELEDQVREKRLEIVTLQSNYDNALKEYAEGEADAAAQRDKRLFSYNNAGEIYAIATDKIDYEYTVAAEDYEDAKEKLSDFDSYIVDDVVSCEYDGVITGVSLQAGDTVENDSAIVTLNNFEDVTVSVEVDDDDMDSVHVGDTVRIYFPSFPEKDFTGRVSDIGDASINDTTSEVSYTVEVAVEGEVSGLYEGMTSEVTFITKETKEVDYVSNRAVIREGTGSWVKVRDADGAVHRQKVETGFSDGNNVEILEGLSEGDTVLIESKVDGK